MTSSVGERRRVRVGDLDLAYRLSGAGRDLLLLHGGGQDADGLPALEAALVAAGHRVIAPDQRGHGATPAAEPWTFEAMADDTAGLLDALGIESADVVGWSDGGIVALVMARRHPRVVRRLVAISASLATDSDPAPVGPEDLEWIRTVDPATIDFPMREADRRSLLDLWAVGPNLRFGDLAGIEAPVLVMAADRDMIVHEHTVAMFRALPHAELSIIPGADHEAPRTHADVIAPIIEQFLAG